MDALQVTASLAIPVDELDFSFSRSGGPGGQHVNTTATKVELRFDVAGSPSLSASQKTRIAEALGNRMTDDGVLVLTASEHRSQARNREAVTARFTTLLAGALRPRRPRKPTRPGPAAKERRLETKRRRAETKRARRPPDVGENT